MTAQICKFIDNVRAFFSPDYRIRRRLIRELLILHKNERFLRARAYEYLKNNDPANHTLAERQLYEINDDIKLLEKVLNDE